MNRHWSLCQAWRLRCFHLVIFKQTVRAVTHLEKLVTAPPALPTRPPTLLLLLLGEPQWPVTILQGRWEIGGQIRKNERYKFIIYSQVWLSRPEDSPDAGDTSSRVTPFGKHLRVSVKCYQGLCKEDICQNQETHLGKVYCRNTSRDSLRRHIQGVNVGKSRETVRM